MAKNKSSCKGKQKSGKQNGEKMIGKSEKPTKRRGNNGKA